MPITNHTITLTINGVDRTSLLQKDSLYMRSSISNDGDVAQFTMRDNGTYSPKGWDPILITINSVDVFGGYIVSKSATDVGVGASHKKAHWQIDCRDWSVLLDQATVNYGYSDSDDTAIIADLFSRYLSSDGFDATTEVDNVKDDIDIYFENITLREALDQLAAISGADWHIAPNKDLYWYATDSPGNAAFDIDTVTPNDSTEFDVLANSITVNVDETTIINRVNVVGGERLIGLQSDEFGTDGTKFRFGLSQKISSVDFISYFINGVAHYARSQDVGFEPEDSHRYAGGDYDVLVNLENRYISIKDVNEDVPDAATGVVASYYYSETIATTVDSVESQGEYGRIFEHNVYDEELTSVALATDYAQRIIDEYAFGRQSITFGVTRHGLLPGRLVSINVPVLEVGDATTNRLKTMDGYFLLLENGDKFLLESNGAAQKFLIQTVEILPIVSQQDDFLIIAKITCGKYIPSLFDSLKKITGSASTGLLPAKRHVGKLDMISNDLGEMRAGRAVFTDGGTAFFSWEDYAGHTGAVIGLEGDGSDAYGAMYILQDGDVRAKIGKLDGLGNVGTITPSGWGIWTDNGYFQGAIAADSGNIGGWTIAANAIHADDGTISTRVPPVNSSNPGVFMNSAGIFSYGTIGLTFSLPSDPAQRPIFSSGTILETVYEVTNAAIIRTGTAGARVQMDNSGIFAYNSSNVLKFSVDAATGRMTAVDGIFSGSVTASQFSGGTITGGIINGGTVTGGAVNGGTITGALVSGGTVSVVGGSVYLSNSIGMNFLSNTSFAFDDQRGLRWRNAAGTRVTGQISAASTSTLNQMYTTSGTPGTINSEMYLRSYGTAGGGISGDYGELGLKNNQFYFSIINNGVQTTPLDITTSSIAVGKNILPDSSGARYLGAGTAGFRGLYLHGDNGSKYLIYVNSSGVLSTSLVL